MLLVVLLIALRAVSATRPAVDLSLQRPLQEQEQIPHIIHQIWPQVASVTRWSCFTAAAVVRQGRRTILVYKCYV